MRISPEQHHFYKHAVLTQSGKPHYVAQTLYLSRRKPYKTPVRAPPTTTKEELGWFCFVFFLSLSLTQHASWWSHSPWWCASRWAGAVQRQGGKKRESGFGTKLSPAALFWSTPRRTKKKKKERKKKKRKDEEEPSWASPPLQIPTQQGDLAFVEVGLISRYLKRALSVCCHCAHGWVTDSVHYLHRWLLHVCGAAVRSQLPALSGQSGTFFCLKRKEKKENYKKSLWLSPDLSITAEVWIHQRGNEVWCCEQHITVRRDQDRRGGGGGGGRDRVFFFLFWWKKTREESSTITSLNTPLIAFMYPSPLHPQLQILPFPPSHQ